MPMTTFSRAARPGSRLLILLEYTHPEDPRIQDGVRLLLQSAGTDMMDYYWGVSSTRD